MEQRASGASRPRQGLGTRAEQARVWLNRARWEGRDNYGVYDLTIGVALVVGFTLFALLPRVGGLAPVVLLILIGAAAWYGSRLEYRQLGSLGHRRARGTLLLGITWVTLLLSGVLGLMVLGVAHLQGWHLLPGWQDVPIYTTVVTALNHLAHGVRLGIRRRLIMGSALCAVVVLLPGVPVLRQNLYLSTAVLTGCLEVVGGLLGRRDYMEALGRHYAAERTAVPGPAGRERTAPPHRDPG